MTPRGEEIAPVPAAGSGESEQRDPRAGHESDRRRDTTAPRDGGEPTRTEGGVQGTVRNERNRAADRFGWKARRH